MRRRISLGTKQLVVILATVLLVVSAGTSVMAQSNRNDGSVTAVIRVDRPMLYPDNTQSRRTLQEALLQAARHTERVHPDLKIEVAWERGIGSTGPTESSAEVSEQYQLTVNAVQDSGTNTISLMLNGTGGDARGQQATGMPLQGEWDGNLYRDLSQQFAYLWAQARGFDRRRDDEAPTYVDELYLAELVGSTITTEGANLYPYSVAVTGGGDVVVGSITLAIRFGPDFRIIDMPGQQLLAEGNYTSAMTVATTPAGSVVTRPSMGRELYLYQPGQAEPARLRNPLTGQGAMTALPDGSIVVVDYANRRAARIEGRQVFPLDIFTQEYSYIPAIAAGPEGNIWAYDTMERQIKIFSPEGMELDAILPILPMDQAAGVRAMAVGESGDFLLLTSGGLWRFDRTGRAIWAIDAIDDPAASPLGQMMGVAWHQASGTVYLADYMGQRLIRLVEGDAADRSSEIGQFTRDLLDINAELRRAGSDATARGELFAQKAVLYEDRGSLEMAQAQWQQVLTEDPFAMEAMDRIDDLESRLLQRQVSLLDDRVRRLLTDFGRETARRDYGRTIILYERILNLDPGLTQMRQAKAELEARFEERDLSDRESYPFEIADLVVEPLFPVLLQRYRNGEAGSFQLRNGGDGVVEIVSATASVAGFSDGVSPIPTPGQIVSGNSVSVDLPVVLNRDALALQEDLPVQVTVAVEYRVNGARDTVSGTATTTIHRRSALIWDDSGKLASFITPNEEVVAGFALRVLAGLEENGRTTGGDAGRGRGETGIENLSPRMARAMRLADALGRYGINYVEDPRSPFSEVQGARQAIDTVRFPRLTLYYRSGDCDDTSALLASLYEAAGLDTAIVTTPGHVLIAVDTQEPESNQWMFETSGTTVIPFEGTLWVPVETTVVERGFAVAWQEGSHIVRRHQDAGEVELIPTRNARERYAALPLPAPTFTITEPPVSAIAAVVRESSDQVNAIVYGAGRLALEEQLAGRAGSRRIPVLNRLGILNARFGYNDRARDMFSEIIELRNDYVPAYVNLANLALAEDKPEEALEYLDQADLLQPDTPAVVELIARANFIAGNGRAARDSVRRLDGIAPERAARLSAIIPPSGTAAEGSGRAARAEDPAAMLPPGEWLVEE